MEHQNRMKVKDEVWKAPQFCAAIFVMISAYTTGQGMTDTFFDGNFICGVGISVGIQLLLVWMGWRIPKLYSMGGRAARVFLVITYTLTIMWSTGFSFVYVCNHIYASFYMRDDQSLLADTYQKSMADLKRRSQLDFNMSLDTVIEGIGKLQENAASIGYEAQGGADGVVPDYGLLKAYYSNDAKVMAAIGQCESISAGKSVGNPDKLLKTMEEALDGLVKLDGRIQGEIETAEEGVRNADERIADYSQKKYRFKAGTTADEEFDGLIAREKVKKEELEREIGELEAEKEENGRILKAVETMDSYVAFKENSVEGVLTTKFARILSELGSASPRMDEVDRLSDEIYTELTTALQTDGSNSAYSGLLKDYLSLKESLNTLEDIRSVQNFCLAEDRAAITAGTELLVGASPSKEERTQWMDLWNAGFVEIKSSYCLLPSASEQEAIRAYDHISWLQRSLLTELNGIERAMYYLFSAHAQLAWFSLILALFLDLTPILLMIIRVQIEKAAIGAFVYEKADLAAN